jgi:large subunit ribosomal protein L5
LSRGVGAAVSDKKLIDYAVDELTKITGQKRYLHFKERCCIFKLKRMPIGAKVTLWGKNVFLDRLITSSLPRVRDFSGIKATGFDGRGNYNLGVIEQIIFQKLTSIKQNIRYGYLFVTTAKTDKEAKSLLTEWDYL